MAIRTTTTQAHRSRRRRNAKRPAKVANTDINLTAAYLLLLYGDENDKAMTRDYMRKCCE